MDCTGFSGRSRARGSGACLGLAASAALARARGRIFIAVDHDRRAQCLPIPRRQGRGASISRPEQFEFESAAALRATPERDKPEKMLTTSTSNAARRVEATIAKPGGRPSEFTGIHRTMRMISCMVE